MKLSYIWYRVFGAPFRLLPIKNNKITIQSYFGKGYCDNPKYIIEELKNNKKLKIICLVKNKDNETPKKIHQVRRGSLLELYHLATSRIWIDNERKTLGVVKRKRQYYIQTWHSTMRLKKIERDAEETLSDEYIKACKKDSQMIDLLLSGNDFSTKIFKRAFWYDGEIAKTGTPRCDALFDNDFKINCSIKVKENFNIGNKKIILYAPTFRSKVEDEVNYLDCQKLSKKLGENYCILARMHPVSKYIIFESENVIDVTRYPDMQELLLSADFLITDYSGCCFDMLLASKPCILYTPDQEEYLSNERGLYFDIDKLPFDNTKTIEQLTKAIKKFDHKEYLKKIRNFTSEIGSYEDGKASIRVAQIIMNIIDNGKK